MPVLIFALLSNIIQNIAFRELLFYIQILRLSQITLIVIQMISTYCKTQDRFQRNTIWKISTWKQNQPWNWSERTTSSTSKLTEMHHFKNLFTYLPFDMAMKTSISASQVCALQREVGHSNQSERKVEIDQFLNISRWLIPLSIKTSLFLSISHTHTFSLSVSISLFLSLALCHVDIWR